MLKLAYTKTKKNFTTVIFLLLSCDSVIAQPISNDSQSQKETMETIEVTGERPADYYRGLMYKAEEDFYSLYNQLTDKNEFKVSCEYRHISAFSRLKKRSCEPAYIDGSRYEETQAAFDTVRKNKIINGNIDKVSLPHHERRRAKKYRELQLKDLKEKLVSSPELLEKYYALVKAKSKYEELK